MLTSEGRLMVAGGRADGQGWRGDGRGSCVWRGGPAGDQLVIR